MVTTRHWIGYAWAVAAVAAATLAGWAMHPRFDLVNIAMVYLLAVVVVALRLSRGPAIAASIMCVLAFDFLFVPPSGTLTVDDAQYLLTFAIMLVVALIISRLVASVRHRAAAQAALEIEAETERIRSALLASFAHALRTPLAVMAGASSSLAENGERLSPAERRALAGSIFDQAREMSEHVAKVLQMTRLETGAIKIDRDWVALGEIVGSVLARLSERMAGHRVIVDLPDDVPRGNGIPIHPSRGRSACDAAGTRARLTWPKRVPRSSSSRTSPRSGASCARLSCWKAIGWSSRRRDAAGPSMPGRTSRISRSSISHFRTSTASR